jgi:hypothetical protein
MDSPVRRIYGRPTMRSRSPGPEPAEPSVFISYRRLDAGGSAGRLHGDLRRHYGPGRVFRDREMRPGTNWVKRLQAVAGACHVMLVVIGPKWATVREDGAPEPRLADPRDTLRNEIETALAREEVTIIPVLVDDARMPATEEVPASLAELLEIQAYPMTDARWDDDLAHLVAELDSVLGAETSVREPRLETSREPVPWPAVLGGAALAGAVAIAVSALLAAAPGEPSAKHAGTGAAAVSRIWHYALERGVLWGLAGAGLLLAWSLATAPGRSPVRPAVSGLLAGALGGALGGAIFQALLYVSNADLMSSPLQLSDDIERIPELVFPAVCLGWALAGYAPNLTRGQGVLAGLGAGLAAAVVQMPLSEVFGKSGWRWAKLTLALAVVIVPLVLAAAAARREARAAPRLSLPAH